jgi:hypothetical protein
LTPRKYIRISFVRCLFEEAYSMSCGKKREVESPQAVTPRSDIPPRGKQVPGAEINGQTLCLKTTIYAKRALIKRLIKMSDKAIILGRNMILSRINGQ